jgi:hypothetical protein
MRRETDSVVERTVVYQMTPEDLRAFFEQEVKRDENAALNALLRRYDGVFVGVGEVATIHGITPQTVRNYIADGLIMPELRAVENGKYRFRLSDVLMLDFGALKKELKAKHYGS